MFSKKELLENMKYEVEMDEYQKPKYKIGDCFYIPVNDYCLGYRYYSSTSKKHFREEYYLTICNLEVCQGRFQYEGNVFDREGKDCGGFAWLRDNDLDGLVLLE